LHNAQVSDALKREIAALNAKIAELDLKFEDLLAAGPAAPGIIEAATKLAHDAAQFEQRVTAKYAEDAAGSETTAEAEDD
jgi:hypothetical protein